MTSRSTVPVTAGLRTADNFSVISRCGADLVRSAITVLALLAFSAPLFAQDNVRIVPLVRDDSVLVSFELTDGYTPQVKEAIHSGLKTTFTYTVELREHVPAWVDRTLGTSVITNTVQYDNLTRTATLTRVVDGQIDDQDMTGDEAVMKRWMTTFSRMPLFKTADLEQNREYYVRVRATARPTNGSILWPFASTIQGLAKFTFLK